MTNRRDFLALLAAAPLPLTGYAQTPWKLATGYKPDGFHGKNLLQLTKDIAALPGELRIELHPDNSLFKLSDIFDAVRAGKLEMGEAIMTGLSKEIPLAGADAVPFVVRSYSDAQRMWKYQRPLIEQKFLALGLRCLMAVPWPPQGLYTNRPVQRVSDLLGSKMRTYNPTTERIAELMGAQAVNVPTAQVRQAFVEGRVDCMITSAITGVDNQMWTQVKNYYEINAWYPKNITFVNAKAFDALPVQTQSNITQACLFAESRGWAESEQLAVESTENLRRRGMKIERVAPEFLTELKRMGERFSLEWIKQVGLEANHIFIPYFTKQ